jgi:uncharacterized YigZ family protein
LSATKDTYKTIDNAITNILYKEKNSKFFGFVYPVLNETDVKRYLEAVKKEHHAARHWCYAYQIGTSQRKFRVNDDGEPNNTAGMPIYGQIQSFDVTNTLIIVVRYFGGVKLGVGGLIQAYKTTAQLALESCKIVEKTINIEFSIAFEYKNMNTVMRVIKEKNLTIVHQQLELSCIIIIAVRKRLAETIFKIFDAIYGVTIKEI